MKKQPSLTIRIACALVFCTFSFLWLYAFQADVLAVAQHVLSGGKTHYDRTVGAVIITAVLMLLQLGVYAMVQLKRRTHALTYMPSMLALAILSSVPENIENSLNTGSWLWGAPLVLLLWGGAVWLSRKMLPFADDAASTGLFSRRMLQNMLLMALEMIFVALTSNTNAVFHFRAHDEVALTRGNTAEVLATGSRSLETDESLMMLRMLALSRQGELGDRLFSYPVAGSSADILPLTGSRSKLQLLSPDSVWRHFGAIPRKGMTTRQYLSALPKDSIVAGRRDSLAVPPYEHYSICGALIDRNLGSFATLVARNYDLTDSLTAVSLPLHYKEALILYKHQTAHPSVIYSDNVTEENFAGFKDLERQYTKKSLRRLRAFENFRNTYWYYYYFGKGAK